MSICKKTETKAVDYKVYQMWPPFLSLKILGLGRQVNWLYRPACVGRLCHSKYKMAATSDILYKSTALIEFIFQAGIFKSIFEGKTDLIQWA